MAAVTYSSQIGQDKFVLNILKQKRNGVFLEIGAGDAIAISNTYTLEKFYDWTGIMVEYEEQHLESYKKHRPNSMHIIQDATTVDYRSVLDANKMPVNMDYLQIDLHVDTRSTLTALEILDRDVFDKYKFATVTFEHDIYTGNHFDTRETSRRIFRKRGYIPVFKDICGYTSYIVFEDWYVHPDLVDMNYVNDLISNNEKNYFDHTVTERSIMYSSITYQ